MPYKFIYILFIIYIVQACSILKIPVFIPANAENIDEWQVEGSFSIKANGKRQKAFFTYKNINQQAEWIIRPENPAHGPFAIISDNEPTDPLAQGSNNAKADAIALSLKNNLALDNMAYWFRGLPATAEAKLQENHNKQIKIINEAGWNIEYKTFMQINAYSLPEKIKIKKPTKNNEIEINFDLVRADTGFLTSPCLGDHYKTSPDTNTISLVDNAKNKNSQLQALVPADGSAPIPRWINKNDFCNQLYKVHGEIPDPRIGLYGPDSMVWEVTGPVFVGGMGAGRTLLLQAAHPWITAGVDEHSTFREDTIGRARRTIISTFAMFYGSMPQIMASANRVHKTHTEVEGKMPYDAGSFKQHSEYRANEISAMIWVHATLWETLVMMYEEVEGPLSSKDKDRFYEETKLFAMLFGIPKEALPKDWESFMAYNQAMWDSPQLTITKNAQAIKHDLFHPGYIWLWLPLRLQETVTAAHLPPRIREGYDMKYGPWQRFNNAWIMTGARFSNWILPDTFRINPLRHEANARIEGQRVGAYHRMLIKRLLGTERLVN